MVPSRWQATGPVSVDDDVTGRYLAENQRLGEQGLRVIATGRRDLDPATFDPAVTCWPW